MTQIMYAHVNKKIIIIKRKSQKNLNKRKVEKNESIY
jgi:hypothetical protein